jgi:epoxyqueuosine reductase QueG
MSDAENNTTRIKALSFRWGGTLFGVADLRSLGRDEILLSPPLIEHHPFSISIGYHLSDSILEGIEDQPTPHYFHHYQRVNILLDTIGLILTSAIQDLGCRAMPVPASQIVDWKNQRGHLSHKHVARLAGLGWIGRNNLLVNETFGSRIRLVTVLTDLPLIADAPLSMDCGSCRDCVKVCPVGAISERPEDFHHLHCYAQLKVFSKTLHFSHHICGICVKACRGRR